MRGKPAPFSLSPHPSSVCAALHRCSLPCAVLSPSFSKPFSSRFPFESLPIPSEPCCGLSPSAVRLKSCQPWQPTAIQGSCTQRWHAGIATFPSSQEAWSSLPSFPGRCSKPLADLEKLLREGGGCASALQHEGAFLYFTKAFLSHFPFLVPLPTSPAALSAVCRTCLGVLGASAELCCSFWVS